MEVRRPDNSNCGNNSGEDAGSSDQGGSCGRKGLWMYFKVGVTGLAVR